MITINDVCVTYNQGTPLEHPGLRSINLRIKEGEFVTIIGGNGAGKSTLMNLLSGEVLASSGSILINNKDVTKLSIENRAKFVSRVFQDPLIGSCADLTIEENLALAFRRGRGRGLGMALNKQTKGYFRELVADLGLGLENRLQDPMSQLSGGQRQAISLLMATLQPSKILLLDEHTAALDPKMARKVMAITTQLITGQKLTALMITHSMSQALEYGMRTILMNDGRIEKDLTGKERQAMTPHDLIELFDVQLL